MRKILVLGTLFLLSACGAQTQKQHVDLRDATYQKDSRTDECYMVLGHTKAGNILGWFGQTEGFTITWVPCDPLVLHAIEQDNR